MEEERCKLAASVLERQEYSVTFSKKIRGNMKKQTTIILYVPLILLLLLNQCSQLKDCGGKCKDATRDCLIKAYAYSAPLTQSISSGSTSTSGAGKFTSSPEAEPNDTFATSYNSAMSDFVNNTYNSNSLGASNTDSYLKTATISSTSDIDIFFAYLDTTNISISIVQKSGIGNVICKLYSRSDTTTYKATTSVPDSTFTLLGTLDKTYSYAARANVPIAFFAICTGTSGSSYSIQVDPYNTSSSSNSLVSSPINIFNYSTFASCAGADASCRKTCSTKL